MTTLTTTTYFRGQKYSEVIEEFNSERGALHAIKTFINNKGVSSDLLEFVYTDTEYPSIDTYYKINIKNFSYLFNISTPY